MLVTLYGWFTIHVEKDKENSCVTPTTTRSKKARVMIGQNRQLVTNEPV